MEHLLIEITPWVKAYGLIVVYFGMIVEGTTMILVAGILTTLHMLPRTETILVAIAGGMTSDHLWFFLGRHYAAKVLAYFPRLQRKIEAYLPRIKGRENWLALGAHFIYSGAVLIPMALGMQGYALRRFSLYDFVGVTLWATGGVFLGALIGNGTQEMFGKIRTVEHFALLVLLVIAGVWYYKKRLKRKFMHKR